MGDAGRAARFAQISNGNAVHDPTLCSFQSGRDSRRAAFPPMTRAMFKAITTNGSGTESPAANCASYLAEEMKNLPKRKASSWPVRPPGRADDGPHCTFRE